MVASGVMALPLGAAKREALTLRVLSAAVLAPVAICAAWLGGALLAALITLAAAVMGWEWGRLADRGRFGTAGVLVAVTEVAGVGVAAVGWPMAALGVLAVGASARFLWPSAEGGASLWAGVGTLWIGAACTALVYLGTDPVTGRATLLWLFALVWATDSAAYLVGRKVGGPRLAPIWSPKKTWSGALAGVVAAGLVGLVTANILGISMLSPVCWISLGLSVAAQAGDLAESAAKRRFGAKDASGLIPGHGGLLDRLDGLLAAAAVAAALTLARGASPVVWS
ncbi:MAG: phosphatidate cytidylyltransferase [Stellaceae bacterium]